MRRIFALPILFTTQYAFAWGPQGHMIVAKVAENNLNPEAKKAVQKLLKNQTLADVANWADYIKGDAQWTHTKAWHYVDIPDGQDYSTAEHSHEGDVVVAITDMVKVLKNESSRQVDKENALKFIVHFVGDIHQPLHVGRPDDRGGNSTRVVFEGRNTNLHALWDSLLIMKSPMDYEDYADSLEDKVMAASYDIPEISFSQIIRECMGARKDIYDFKVRGDGPIILDEDYYKKNLALMNSHLLAGGKRLATLLNTAFSR